MRLRGAAVEGARRSRWSSPGRRSPPPGRPARACRRSSSLASDRRARAVGGRRALQLGQRVGDHLGRQDVVEGVLLLELRVRVVDRVLVVLVADLREMLCGGAVLASCARGRRRRTSTAPPGIANSSISASALTCLPIGDSRSWAPPLQRAGLHLLEAQRDRAVGQCRRGWPAPPGTAPSNRWSSCC